VKSFILAGYVALSGAAEPVEFVSAKPVWPEGREREKNLTVGFRAVFEAATDRPNVLRVTASTLYRVFINGVFVGHGPARAAHGYFRVDEWDFSPFVGEGRVVVAIEVAGYNVNSYYLLDQPSFLQAEVIAGGDVLVSTGGAGTPFIASILAERVQKVQRYSFQRPFIEVYRLAPDHGQWRTDPDAPFPESPCTVQPSVFLLSRRVPYPRFGKCPALRHCAQGAVIPDADPNRTWNDRSVAGIGPELGGFPREELEVEVSDELARMGTGSVKTLDRLVSSETKFVLSQDEFHIIDFGANRTGFTGARVECTNPCRLYFVFDEILSNDDVSFNRLGCVSAVTYEMPAGTFCVESFEPYTLRFLKLISVRGSCVVQDIYVREYVNPDTVEAEFACSDARLDVLFAAGRETFRQNAVDIFMDCPSRERAGWLCDSFFTARAAYALNGHARIERGVPLGGGVKKGTRDG